MLKAVMNEVSVMRQVFKKQVSKDQYRAISCFPTGSSDSSANLAQTLNFNISFLRSHTEKCLFLHTRLHFCSFLIGLLIISIAHDLFGAINLGFNCKKTINYFECAQNTLYTEGLTDHDALFASNSCKVKQSCAEDACHVAKAAN